MLGSAHGSANPLARGARLAQQGKPESNVSNVLGRASQSLTSLADHIAKSNWAPRRLAFIFYRECGPCSTICEIICAAPDRLFFFSWHRYRKFVQCHPTREDRPPFLALLQLVEKREKERETSNCQGLAVLRIEPPPFSPLLFFWLLAIMSTPATPTTEGAPAGENGRKAGIAPLVCVVDFHHARGPEVERWFGAEEGSDPAAEFDWPLLPFMALSDGAHA